ncbi:hypothetical protein SOVF_186280 [Spinacia oleracea]|nr:hypothetical protein SOVF_186280 [Spinacia oleracea]
MSTFAKPENALKRAEELINVGQKQDALQALHDLITSKRYRAWQKPLEKIMFKYIELCVDMRKGRYAKDGLIQYRIVCQQVNVNSLEEVIKHFMHLSTERAEVARTEAQALEEALDVEDLEADKRPEDLMLSYVSGEKGKDRSDRELVTPWFKFLWETYRTVLEILRNNSKLENLYADLESDTVRNHLTALAESLNKARSMIYPPLNKASKIEDTLPGLAELVEKEHKKLLARKTIIEQRKEEQERQLLEKEREEESKRLQLQKSNVEAEQKRLASELEKRKIQRIQKEIEEREIEEAKALLQEKFSKNKKKPLIEGDKLTKQALMELALNEQLREKQEMEKKLLKLSKQMDYLERAKREEAAPLIESAYQQRLVEEQLLHER